MKRIVIRNSYEAREGEYDLTVFIDVFRASTSLIYLFEQGVADVVATISEPQVERLVNQGYLLTSELSTQGIDNSPSMILKSDLLGKKVVQKTGNFTASIFSNLDFNEAIAASFANMSAVVDYIKSKGVESIELIACAHFEERVPAVEDISCALMVKSFLLGDTPSEIPLTEEINQKIKSRQLLPKIFREHYWKDLQMALELDYSRIVPKLCSADTQLVRFEKSIK